MEASLKKELGTSMLKATGHSGGGCISEGRSYDTDSGRIFVKINHKSQAKLMFDGEAASLDAILKTGTVKVPQPIKVIDLNTGGAVFAMEHVDMRSLSRYSAQLGDQLADLHLHNQRQKEQRDEEERTGKDLDSLRFLSLRSMASTFQPAVVTCQWSMTGRATGLPSTPSRGSSTSWGCWSSPVEIERRGNFGLSCTLRSP